MRYSPDTPELLKKIASARDELETALLLAGEHRADRLATSQLSEVEQQALHDAVGLLKAAVNNITSALAIGLTNPSPFTNTVIAEQRHAEFLKLVEANNAKMRSNL